MDNPTDTITMKGASRMAEEAYRQGRLDGIAAAESRAERFLEMAKADLHEIRDALMDGASAPKLESMLRAAIESTRIGLRK